MNLPNWQVCVCFLVELIRSHFVNSATETNGCDATVWDDNLPDRGVYVVNAQCAEGHVDWRHPHGAVRLSLQLPPRPSIHPPQTSPTTSSSPSSSSSTPSSATYPSLVEVCFKAKTHLVITKISLERDQNVKLKNAPLLQPLSDAGLYSRENLADNLEKLVVLNDTAPYMDREICFLSHGGAAVVLYLEAVEDIRSRISGHVSLEYDMRPTARRRTASSANQDAEVIKASVEAVLHNQDTFESHLRVRVEDIHKQRHPVFKRSITPHSTYIRGRYVKSNENHNTLGSIVAPLKCGVKKSDGYFVFMGQIKLKKPFLECAPRLEYFEELWKAAVRIGVNPCTLE